MAHHKPDRTASKAASLSARGARRRSGARNLRPHNMQTYFLFRVRKIIRRSKASRRLINNSSEQHLGHIESLD